MIKATNASQHQEEKKIELFLCLIIRNYLVMKQLPAEDENNKKKYYTKNFPPLFEPTER